MCILYYRYKLNTERLQSRVSKHYLLNCPTSTSAYTSLYLSHTLYINTIHIYSNHSFLFPPHQRDRDILLIYVQLQISYPFLSVTFSRISPARVGRGRYMYRKSHRRKKERRCNQTEATRVCVCDGYIYYSRSRCYIYIYTGAQFAHDKTSR